MEKYNYKGWLAYNSSNDRYGILSNTGSWVNDGFHCGTCFEVKVNAKWVQTRIEFSWDSQSWYLVGLPYVELEQLPVRM